MKKYDITRINIEKPSAGRVKIAHISDLHDSPDYPEILRILEDERADFIVVTGDFSNRYKATYENGLEFLRKAAKSKPVFLSYGNHEVSCNVKKDILEKTGAAVLDNEFMRHDKFIIGGLTSSKSFSDFEFLDKFSAEKNGFKLLLCHHPEFYNRFLKGYDIDLILAGHAHGGQVRLPFIGGLFSPGQGLFPQLTSGIHFDKLVISRGLGNPNKLPRWFNRPEIVFIEFF